MIIETRRLGLVPLSIEFLRAALDGDVERAGRLLGVLLDDRPPIHPDTLRRRLQQLEIDVTLQPWLLRGIIHRETRTLIGHIGFHTGPRPEYLNKLAPGGIEMGYTVFAPLRRQGFATEAIIGLMDWARSNHDINRFVVSISPRNEPSLALAAKLGFERVGEQIDEVDGLEYVFRRDFSKDLRA